MLKINYKRWTVENWILILTSMEWKDFWSAYEQLWFEKDDLLVSRSFDFLMSAPWLYQQEVLSAKMKENIKLLQMFIAKLPQLFVYLKKLIMHRKDVFYNSTCKSNVNNYPIRSRAWVKFVQSRYMGYTIFLLIKVTN